MSEGCSASVLSYSCKQWLLKKTCIKLREAEINSPQNVWKLCENQQFEYGYMLKKMSLVLLYIRNWNNVCSDIFDLTNMTPFNKYKLFTHNVFFC